MEGNNAKVIENAEGKYKGIAIIFTNNGLSFFRLKNNSLNSGFHRRWPETRWNSSKETSKYSSIFAPRHF